MPRWGAMDNGRAVSLASDAELWRRAVAGGQAAFGDLFDRHANAIYNFCLRRTGDASTAEDLMSTAFLHAWRRRTEVVLIDDRPLPWLYGIAANLCRRHRRGMGRRRAAMGRLAVPRPEPDPAEDVARRLDDQRIGERALDLLESLPERDQELFVLCVWQGLSYKEAALALDIPVGTVRSRLSRARSRLRRLLTEPAPVGGDEWGEQGSERRRKEDASDG